ncbi:hypothetical protein PCANC_14683 [Puccinia coronata f. sp. avenae]|uniref:Uncharacterized protein n=1 Tax=Puccinia coronata f. sp. avenae TaxID=200324 RepID=A0A2N5UCI6_9BASI|nr:hypothetical protein PCANC_14683 [Puccinia coronata f. sp. avenae]
MRVGIWMFRGWMLASSGVFQPVVGMGEDWVAARGWRGSSGIESTSRTRMQPIYDGASGSSTGSDRLNLNQGLGVPSGKGKYQQGEPHIDTTSPLGADAYSAGESSAAPAQVNLALELGPPSGKRKAEPHNNSREAADTRLTLSLGGSRPLKLAKTDQGNGPGSWAWIQKCGSERITELQQWLDAILKQFSVPDGGEKRTLSPQSLEQISFMSSQVHCAISLVIGLFQDKLRHLNDPGVDKILLQRNMNESGQRLLTSIAQIQMDSISRKSEVDFWKSPMLESSWYRMMMNLLSDFQTHEILLDTLLSDYLNQQTHGQIIWHYLNSISIPSVPTLYLNFDVKLSLLEDPSMEKYRNIFQMLNEETWKNIEAEHILYHSSYFTETNPYFEPVHSAFKKLAMKSRKHRGFKSDNFQGQDGLRYAEICITLSFKGAIHSMDKGNLL